MSDFGSNMKKIWLKGMEAIGNTASNIASNTKSKVDEMNLVNRRTEILKDFGSQAYVLWQKGEHFPEELERQLRELQKLDERLNDLRAERLAGVKADAVPEVEYADGEKTEHEESVPPEQDEFSAAETENTESEGQEMMQETEQKNDEEVPIPDVPATDSSDENKPLSGISEAINDLFDKIPSAQETAEKVNGALDTLEGEIQQFSTTLDEKLNDLSEKL